jgi:hypothetical protein
VIDKISSGLSCQVSDYMVKAPASITRYRWPDHVLGEQRPSGTASGFDGF